MGIFSAVVKPLLDALPQGHLTLPTGDSGFFGWLASIDQVVPILTVLSQLIAGLGLALVVLLALRFGTWLYRLIPGKFT
jgi:hypothetical protein